MNSDKYKNYCLKLKSEVGMEVLKSKQTRVVYRDNQHIRIVHPYACLLSTTLAVLVNKSSSITQSDEPIRKQA